MFIQPIAIKCNQQQFDDIKGELKELGYEIIDIESFARYEYLTNNVGNKLGDISNITDLFIKDHNRIVFETWNKDLFLALAAITNETNGIPGEWWKSLSTDCSGEQFIAGNILN